MNEKMILPNTNATRIGFKKVLKMIDNNKAMEELANFEFNTSSEIWSNDSSTDVLV